MRRVATDTELAGTQLKRDAFLILGLASANRDDAQFARPTSMTLTATPQSSANTWHSTVGSTHASEQPWSESKQPPHSTRSSNRVTAIELADTTYRRVRHFMMRGPRELPVTFTT